MLPMGLTLALTGATGFVGGHVLAAAQTAGHRIRALTRRPQPPRAGVDWVPGDLADQTSLERLVAGADVVVHVAGVTNALDTAAFMAGNAAGSQAMVRAAGTRPFVHVSSLAARTPRLSAYGASKAHGEDAVRAHAGPFVIVRPPAVYGPADTQLVPVFRAARRGFLPLPAGQRAAFLYAPDLAQALVALAQDLVGDGRSAGGTYEIDDGAEGYDARALAQAFGQALGRRVRALTVPPVLLRAGGRVATAWARLTGGLPPLSSDRARYLAYRDWTADSGPLRALGLWRPATPLAQGLALTAAWYRRQGWL